MSVRRPRTAVQSSALPSLAALLASGVVVDGCNAPVEDAARLQRLTEHGERAGRALEGSRHGEAATEVARGLGLLDTPQSTRIQAPGEAPVVQVEAPIETAGAAAPTQPTPPVETPPVDVDGGIREVRPTPPPVIRAPNPPRVHRVPVRGGAPAVRPGSSDDPF
jgi:hypothetical protein